MSVEDNTSPRFGFNHPFNTGLGTPIAGSSQHILVCGDRRLARAVVEIEDAANTGFAMPLGLPENWRTWS